MRRQGIRRLKSYNAAYDLAAEFYETMRSDFNKIINPIIRDTPEVPFAPVATVRLLRQFMGVAKELKYKLPNNLENNIYLRDIKNIEKALGIIAISRRGEQTVWTCAVTLMEIDPIANLEVSNRIINSIKTDPKNSRHVFDFINWANLAQEYDMATKIFEVQPTEI